MEKEVCSFRDSRQKQTAGKWPKEDKNGEGYHKIAVEIAAERLGDGGFRLDPW